MRFLFITQYYAPEIGAPQVRLRAIGRELKARGHEIEVVTALPSYPHGRIFQGYRARFTVREAIDGLIVHRVWAWPAQGGGLKRMLGYLSFAVLSLSALFTVKEPDVIFVESPPLTLAVTGYLYRRRFPRATLIFNVADLWPDLARDLSVLRDVPLLRFLYRLEAWAYRRADFVSYITQGYGRILQGQKGVPVGKLMFLPNGVDFRCEKATLSQTMVDLPLADKMVFAVIGTHGFAHGIDVVLRAAKLLEKEPVLFLCLGEGSDKPRLLELAAHLQCTNVVFHDAVPPDVVAATYDIVYASLATQRGLSCFDCARPVRALTAMAAGKPVLFSGRGEGAELVRQAGAGIVTPPEDSAALAEAIRWLIAHREEAAEMGRRGRAYVEQHLSWTKVVGNWLQDLEE